MRHALCLSLFERGLKIRYLATQMVKPIQELVKGIFFYKTPHLQQDKDIGILKC
jgi:hypothetical protein